MEMKLAPSPKVAPPAADSAANAYMSDVVGNKTDTTAGDSLVSLAKGLGVGANHKRLYPSTIYYVDADRADDTGDGLAPGTAKKTIGAAITAAYAGDAISIRAGTYAENVVMPFGKDGLQLWPEIGTIISGTGTPLTLAGSYCKLSCPGGSLLITPAANQTGVTVSGDFNYLSDVRVKNASSADLGFDVTATSSGTVFANCRCSDPLIAAFKIQGDAFKADGCCTGGKTADTSIGFWFLGTADKPRLKDCSSQGHASGGFVVDTGATNGVIKDCSSGGGDGRWVDADSAFVWSGFTYDDRVYKLLTFTGAGGATANLFRVYGSVLITELSGEVGTVLAGDIGTGFLELGDGTNDIDVTDSPGPSFDSLPAASFIHKIDDAGIQVAIEDSSQVRLYEDATKFGEDPHFQITAKAGVATYIQFTYSGNGASGSIHWHCKWTPLSDDGFVTRV